MIEKVKLLKKWGGHRKGATVSCDPERAAQLRRDGLAGQSENTEEVLNGSDIAGNGPVSRGARVIDGSREEGGSDAG